MGSRLLAVSLALVAAAGAVQLHMVCSEANDVFKILLAAGHPNMTRHASVALALAAAQPGDGLMLLADQLRDATSSPQCNATVQISPSQWAAMATLRVYAEFPSTTPGEPGPPQCAQTMYERVVVTGNGTGLPALAILNPHKHVDFAILPQGWAARAELLLAKVAGYDTATSGLPNVTHPLLVQASESVLVAATQLSHMQTRRFAPSKSWMAVLKYIIGFVAGPLSLPEPLWVPTVRASFGPTEALPADAELQAVHRGVEFYRNAKLMPTAQRAAQLAGLQCDKGADTSEGCAGFARLEPPWDQPESAEGQLGMLEGYTSDISLEQGSSPQSIGLRADCTTESSASFAVRAVLTSNSTDALVATNLLNYVHLHGGFSQPWVVGAGPTLRAQRPWTSDGNGFGLMAWTTSENAYREYYSDDDARGLLGAIATAGLLQSERWHSTIATAVLGNLRFTSQNGFGYSSQGFPNLGAWRSVYESAGVTPYYSPHYVCYMWAVYLWGFQVSGLEPLYQRAQAGIAEMMRGYPHKWVPTANGIAMQRARMLLPLAFLVRVNNTEEHRGWLDQVVEGLLGLQHCEGSWCAFIEELSHPGWGGSTRVPNNDDYGTFEAPLNQENGDPVSDFLYTSNFALLGLHEAAAATLDPKLRAAEDALAEFVVRIQARSEVHPQADGAFFRAFDYRKWEVWGSDADIGWGAWSVESGWTQSWLTTSLGLRELNSSLWELGGSIKGIKPDFQTWASTMLAPPPPGPCIPAATPLEYNLSTTLQALCARDNVPVHVLYQGTVCSGKDVQWTSMRTLDPASGLLPSDCQWSADKDPGDVPSFLGSCGIAPTAVTLPTQVC